MWHVVNGKRSVFGFNTEVEDTQIESYDDFILIQEGLTREKPITKCVIFTKFYLRKWSTSPEVNEGLILSHAKGIESGLLYFPSSKYFKDKPIKEVWFDISTSMQPHLLKAGEI